MRDRRISRGIQRTQYGWRLYARIKGTLRTHRIRDPHHEKELADLKDARDTFRVAAKTPSTPQPSPERTLFEHDVEERYLPAVLSMPTFVERKRHMEEWAEAFRGRQRDDVKPLDIRTVLERRRADGLSPSSCNKRRTALQSFYTRLNGKSGYNPVRDVEKYEEDEEPHDHPLPLLYRVLACMRPSVTRARLRVFLWTGWPHVQVKRLRPEHLDLARSRAFVTPRRKGKGRKGVWLPLLPGAVIALREFVAYRGFTPTVKGKLVPFSNAAMYKSLQLAVTKFNRHRAHFGHEPITIRPYDFRHSFLTWVADHLDDDRVLQELAMHSRPEQSLRYTRRATERRLARGMATLVGVTSTGNFLPRQTTSTDSARQIAATASEEKSRGRRRRTAKKRK